MKDLLKVSEDLTTKNAKNAKERFTTKSAQQSRDQKEYLTTKDATVTKQRALVRHPERKRGS